MFLRQLSIRRADKTYTYLKVVESVWARGRTVQKTLVNLGNVAGWPPERRQQLLAVLTRFLAPAGVPSGGLALSEVRVEACRQVGPYLPLAALWDKLALDGILACAWVGRKVDGQALEAVKAMVLTRLVEPCSKLAVWERVAERVLIPGLATPPSLASYYRALDYLCQAKAEVEQAVHQQLRHLFNQDVSLVFYDLTSAYFEGTHCGKAKRGYSREHRPDLLQIEIGLLVDAEGLPIGHEVFDGNVKEVTTVLGTLDRLQREFGVRRCVFVGDDGMASAANLAEIARRGYEYITSVALGRSRLGRQRLQAAPPPWRWRRVTETLLVQPLGGEGAVRYLGSYHPERAASTRRHRRHHLRVVLDALRALCAGPKPRGKKKTPAQVLQAADRVVRRHGCQAWIGLGQTEEGALTWTLERAALRQTRRQDGVLVLQTNAATLTDEEVARGYRALWRVEDAFRHLKDGLRLRPIRHWNDTRVLGHVFVCVLAYLLECLYDRALARAGLTVTARAALEELAAVQVATLTAGSCVLRRRSELTARHRELLAAAGITHVPELW
jgi:hypothetical protein